MQQQIRTKESIHIKELITQWNQFIIIIILKEGKSSITNLLTGTQVSALIVTVSALKQSKGLVSKLCIKKVTLGFTSLERPPFAKCKITFHNLIYQQKMKQKVKVIMQR